MNDEAWKSLVERMAEHGARQPERLAFAAEDRSVTWGEFDQRIGLVAAALRKLGVGKGDKVAVLSRNSIEAVEAFFGALRAGCCAVPLSGMTAPETQRLLLDDSDAKVLLCSDDCRASLAGVEVALAKLVPGGRIAFDFADPQWQPYEAWLESARGGDTRPAAISPSDDFNIIYSSGTTGVPKGILHSHAMRVGTTRRADRWGFRPDTINIMSTPLYSNTTMAALLPSIGGGGATVLMRKFDEQKFLELCQRWRVTHAMLVPVQYARLLAYPEFDRYDLSSFVLKLCTSAPLRAELKREILARWPGDMIEIYGLTEGGAVCILDARKHPDKLHTVGKPSPISDVRIIDEQGKELPVGEIGEVVGRQQVMMTGYYKKPKETEAIYWYDAAGNRFQRSGDLGRFDTDGFLQLLDRKKDMIISGGFNVYAADLEVVLSQHEAVADVAVIGVPSERWGETPIGLVVLKPGCAVDAAALQAWANERLGKNQRLSAIEIRESLPRSPIGKLLKRELRAPYWAATGQSI
jgi:acyl-CoA synthetase (AMP-forming)/AMP-acid ligase II